MDLVKLTLTLFSFYQIDSDPISLEFNENRVRVEFCRAVKIGSESNIAQKANIKLTLTLFSFYQIDSDPISLEFNENRVRVEFCRAVKIGSESNILKKQILN
jgi:hypothetical protein